MIVISKDKKGKELDTEDIELDEEIELDDDIDESEDDLMKEEEILDDEELDEEATSTKNKIIIFSTIFHILLYQVLHLL